MDDFNKLFPKNLYHSYIVEGDPSSVGFSLKKFFEERGDIDFQSPDILFQIYDSFTINNSSLIKNWHSQMRVHPSHRFGLNQYPQTLCAPHLESSFECRHFRR